MQNSHVREALSFGFPSKNHSKKDMSKVYNYVVVKKWSLKKKKTKTLESVNKDKSMQSKNKVMSYHEEFFFTLFLFFLI